jgi:putrescine aminotransferase
MVCDEVANVIGSGEFAHGYTYSGHPMSCAVALENLRILQEEKIVETVANDTGPYLAEKWTALADHPLVGESRIVGMMGSLALTPDKSARAQFSASAGTVGLICRTRCFANGLVMRHVGDRMIISPPLVITKSEIDTLIERAAKSLDEAYQLVRQEGLLKAA